MDNVVKPNGQTSKIDAEIKTNINSDWHSIDEMLVKKHGPLLFFKENEKNFPIISRLAKAVLSVMPSSTPVESVFS